MTDTTRRRAPAMSLEQRRASIVGAALPLLIRHGARVTTSQIATAAGVAEGTVFRAFTDKTELIGACLHHVMDPEDTLDAIAAVSPDLPLNKRLSIAAHHMADNMHAVSMLVRALAATGYRLERGAGTVPVDREKWIAELTDAVVDLIGLDATTLRIPARRAAQIFQGMVFVSTLHDRMPGEEAPTDEPPDVDEMVDVFLHGVLTSPHQ